MFWYSEIDGGERTALDSGYFYIGEISTVTHYTDVQVGHSASVDMLEARLCDCSDKSITNKHCRKYITTVIFNLWASMAHIVH